MASVILVIHLFLALAIIGLVLLQRSEGGGLGIGGSGGLGGLATPQGTANVLTRATAICAAAFFATSLILGSMAVHRGSASLADRLDTAANVPAATTPAANTSEAAETADAAPSTAPEPVPSVPASQ